MARRYRRRGHRRGGMKLPIISLAILGGQLLYANSLGGDLGQKVNVFQSFYTGFLPGATPAFRPEGLLIGYGPWLAKRFLMPIARPRMPLHGLPVSLS